MLNTKTRISDWESQAFSYFAIGRKDDAVRSLLLGAHLFRGDGRAHRLIGWARAIGEELVGFRFMDGDESFADVEARYWNDYEDSCRHDLESCTRRSLDQIPYPLEQIA